MGRWICSVATVAALLVVPAAYAGATRTPEVMTDKGPVRGVASDGMLSYRGIPYAQAPIGDLRWRAPQPASSWSTVLDASRFAPACPQPARNSANRRRDGLAVDPAEQSEDCLSLNVWTSDLRATAPVMLWIHGGAHRFGSASLPFYDGTALARHGVVVVSINYRLGLLGYFAHPAVTSTIPAEEHAGNFGMLDQIAALQWVQRNIAAFGGDPRNVTVFGESAGGASILYLLATKNAAQGLFAKAIVESGGGWQRTVTLNQKQQQDERAIASLGLPQPVTVEQLRKLTTEQLNRAITVAPLLNFGPFVDGRLVARTPADSFLAGEALDVPLMIGWNSYEASLLDAAGTAPAALLAMFTREEQARLRELYRGEATDDDALARAVFTDASFAAPARWIAAHAHEGAPAWLYHFDYTLQARRNSQGANHGAEIPYVFGTLDAIPVLRSQISPRDRAVSAMISSCWVAFASAGRPECEGTPRWPAYEPDADVLLRFGDSAEALRGFRRTQLDHQNEVFSQRPEVMK